MPKHNEPISVFRPVVRVTKHRLKSVYFVGVIGGEEHVGGTGGSKNTGFFAWRGGQVSPGGYTSDIQFLLVRWGRARPPPPCAAPPALNKKAA
ncbi:unnamed protein product [Colias eurytheme]|nr:unnamed protein product [Colias eurytheme]